MYKKRKEEYNTNQYLPSVPQNITLPKAPSNKPTDSVGLEKAYGTNKGIYLSPDGTNLYVAGTKSLGDVFDDLKLPLPHGARGTTRYQDVMQYIRENPDSTKNP